MSKSLSRYWKWSAVMRKISKKEKEKRKPKKSIKPLETLFQGITLKQGFFIETEKKKEEKFFLLYLTGILL